MPAKKPAKKKSTKPSMREIVNSRNSKPKRSFRPSGSRLGKIFRRGSEAKKRRKFARLPDNRFGRVIDKTALILPRYLKGAWEEIRLTTWPNRKETIRLTFAVFIFSSVFAVFVAALDFILDKIFKHLIIK
ncbi:MAG TPA: preprotein translocase subunit SecE [Candidatus Saccharimonadales bacterium]|nr:preprotein translocase subunit SecE [Candidatus Saccharimonadales bacterium]